MYYQQLEESNAYGQYRQINCHNNHAGYQSVNRKMMIPATLEKEVRIPYCSQRDAAPAILITLLMVLQDLKE